MITVDVLFYIGADASWRNGRGRRSLADGRIISAGTHHSGLRIAWSAVYTGNLLTFLAKGPVGYGAGILAGWLRTRPAVLSWINRTSGRIPVALGLKPALARHI